MGSKEYRSEDSQQQVLNVYDSSKWRRRSVMTSTEHWLRTALNLTQAIQRLRIPRLTTMVWNLSFCLRVKYQKSSPSTHDMAGPMALQSIIDNTPWEYSRRRTSGRSQWSNVKNSTTTVSTRMEAHSLFQSMLNRLVCRITPLSPSDQTICYLW